MKLTWLDNNSWLIEMGSKTILLDPWLIGDLVFGGQTWLFRGIKQTAFEIPSQIDLILLSQGLEDHSHIPTLEKLDHQIPVVASPSAAKVVEQLGYSQITPLDHGQSYCLDNEIEIKAFEGSQLGPTLTENAYVVKNLSDQHSIYYEPHGNHSAKLAQIAPIDVVITPVIDFKLLKFAPVLNGQKTTLKLCQSLRPQVVLPTARADDTKYEGALTMLLQEEGTFDSFRQMLADHQLSAQLMQPQPYKPIELSFQSTVNS
ncbi:MAG: MBL fold metallo-hydrolase [Microcystaceae cyanobacterium]